MINSKDYTDVLCGKALCLFFSVFPVFSVV